MNIKKRSIHEQSSSSKPKAKHTILILDAIDHLYESTWVSGLLGCPEIDDCAVETNWTALDYADAVVFDVSKVQLSKEAYYPKERKFPKQLFVGLSVENPTYYPSQLNQTYLETTYNLTGSYRFLDSDSHITVGYGPVPAYGQKIQFDITAMKEIPKPKELLVNFIQQNCYGHMGRTQIVEEIMKLIDVDSMGPCLRNKNVTQVYGMVNSNVQKTELIKNYVFTLALENTRCVDYITEKLWQPMTVGSIPVYLGAPNVRDYLPDPDAAILIEDFKTVNDLVDYMLEVANNQTLQYKHLKWITNPDRFTKWKAYTDSKKASKDIFCKILLVLDGNLNTVYETAWSKEVLDRKPICPEIPECQVETDWKYRDTADAVVYELTKIYMQPETYPMDRKHPKQLFVGLTQENPSYYPLLINETYLQETFNMTGSYRLLDSESFLNIPCGPFPFEPMKIHYDIDVLRGQMPPARPNMFNFVQSNCYGFMGRREIMENVMSLMEVDALGRCLNNKNITHPWGLLDTSAQKMAIIQNYTFTFALENTRCVDYITEKLWQPLSVGSIPIYLGAPNVRDYLPDPDAIISIADFATIEDLVTYIKRVATDETLRYKHLKWIVDPEARSKWRSYYQTKETSKNFFCKICRNIQKVKASDIKISPPKDSWVKCEGQYEIPLKVLVLDGDLNTVYETAWSKEVLDRKPICPEIPECQVETDWKYRDTADAVVYELSKIYMQPETYPMDRKHPKQLFVGLTQENPSYYPLLINETYLQETFNMTGSYRFLDSDSYLNLPYGPFPFEPMKIHFDIDKHKGQMPPARPNMANFVQSNCYGFMGRREIMENIMSLMEVDALGRCLNNKNITHPWGLLDTSAQKMAIIQSYTFTFALENTRCVDYITEKLWQPMSLGSIPIYLGAPNVRDYLPDPDAIISIADFATIEDLVTYIKRVATDETLRYKHLKWIVDPEARSKWRSYYESKETSKNFFCKICRNIQKVKAYDIKISPPKDSWVKCEGKYEIPLKGSRLIVWHIVLN
eukprot:gene189-227_t